MTFSATSLLPVSPTWINTTGTELIYLLPIVSWSLRGWFQREIANYLLLKPRKQSLCAQLSFQFCYHTNAELLLPRVRRQEETTDNFKTSLQPYNGGKPGNFRMLTFAPGKATYLLITVSRERRKNTSTSSLSDDKLQGHSTYKVNF